MKLFSLPIIIGRKLKNSLIALLLILLIFVIFLPFSIYYFGHGKSMYRNCYQKKYYVSDKYKCYPWLYFDVLIGLPAIIIDAITPFDFRWSLGSRGICMSDYGGIRFRDRIIVTWWHDCSPI